MKTTAKIELTPLKPNNNNKLSRHKQTHELILSKKIHTHTQPNY